MGRFKSLKNDENQDVITNEERIKRENSISKATLSLIEDFSISPENSLDDISIPKKERDFRMVFTPSTPPRISSLLVGRNNDLRKTTKLSRHSRGPPSCTRP